jgi:alpha-ketoglutarate-dependent taurine dioxygenase
MRKQKLTSPIEFIGVDDFEKNIKAYADIFLKDAILIFRNANLTESDQRRVQEIFGDYFGIYPNSENKLEQRYIEDHSAIKEFNTSKDELMLGWHMEHLYFSNPILAGFWNMHTFKTDPENGKTYFYDARKLYNKIPVDWKEFLHKCVIDTSFHINTLDTTNHTPAIRSHWLTNEPTLRIPINRIDPDFHPLITFDGEPATADQKDEYERISLEIRHLLVGDTSTMIEHKWQQGDLVIPDIYCMLHAVAGGFNSEDRIFTGMWSYLKPIDQ